MSAPSTDLLYEVHVIESPNAEWRLAASFDTLESARVAAVHLIQDSTTASVRIMHIVEYYSKNVPAETTA
jgi:hypothetical protein